MSAGPTHDGTRRSLSPGVWFLVSRFSFLESRKGRSCWSKKDGQERARASSDLIKLRPRTRVGRIEFRQEEGEEGCRQICDLACAQLHQNTGDGTK